jgi:hypothetical protein
LTLARRGGVPGVRLRAHVERRAHGRCEYCHAPQLVCGYRFHVEHIVPVAHGGRDDAANSALACSACNLAKGSALTGVDPQTARRVPLFNPRKQIWVEHFAWAADRQTVVGLTPTGRATIAALDMNNALRKEGRLLWFAVGWLP